MWPAFRMSGTIRQQAALARASAAWLLVARLTWAGCAARGYPGPVHGLTFDGTIQSIDLT
jgi:hypothetical protein